MFHAPRISLPFTRQTLTTCLFGALIAAYFLHFTLPGLSAGFSGDDMMNIDGYWRTKAWKLAWVQLTYFTDYYRPLGGLFYLPIYYFARLNPVPYHVVFCLILALNTWLVYKFTILLSGERLPAGIAALIVAYHPKLAAIYYSTAVIYDVLCFLFYFVTVCVYVNIRKQGRFPNRREWVGLIVCYIFCLDAKEMGATLPIALLAYEFINHPPAYSGWRRIARWMATEGRCGLVLGALTVPYALSKVIGPHAMAANSAYRPVLSLGQFLKVNSDALNTLLFKQFFNPHITVLLWLVLIYLGWSRKWPALQFASLFMIFATLPIGFIPQRNGYALYIPFAGYAIAAATLLVRCIRYLAAEPLFSPLPMGVAHAALLGCSLFLFVREMAYQTSPRTFGELREAEEHTSVTISEFQRLRPKLKPGSKVIFLRSPFPEQDWDLIFIVDLWFNDHSLRIWLQEKTNLPEAEVAAMDYIFDFRKGRLVQLKPSLNH